MWNKITLYKFQRIEAIDQKAIPDIDKTLFSTCIAFDYTEYQLDNMDVKKVGRLTQKLTRIFNTPFEPRPYNRIGRYKVNYDVSKITLGQFIELSFYLSQDPLQNAHYVLASLTNRKVDHKKKADYFLGKPITKITGSLALIVEKFTSFIKEYSWLFGLDKEVTAEEEQTHPFNKRYGWIFSASLIAEYERISLDEAKRLPIRQAFNDLAYLKAKTRYDLEQSKLK